MVVGVAAASVAALNLTLVWLHVEREQRNLQVFTAPVSLLPRGATFLAVKPPPPSGELVDPRAAEYYCLAARAVCLSGYEPATRHFPIRLRPGVKQRIKENRPGSFWVDAVLGDGASPESLPGTDEPYREVYRSGTLRLFVRREGAPASR
jgi:hypothetical protein